MEESTYKWGKKNDQQVEEVTKAPKDEVLVKEPSILEVVDNRIYFYSSVNRQSILKLNKTI